MSGPIRVAVIDLYNGTPNQGMRAIRELLGRNDGHVRNHPLDVTFFDARRRGEIPDLSYDIYLSTGGPGSPFEGAGERWETDYFHWLDAILDYDQRGSGPPKAALLICHSFQMMCRHLGIAEVVERRSQSFGVFPVHKTRAGHRDVLFGPLPDPFFAADFRHWQVVQPNKARLRAMGAKILAVEKKRPHVKLERATMAIRLSPSIVGTQFHPEADPEGMGKHFRTGDVRARIIEKHGAEKFERILSRVTDPEYLQVTHDGLIPRFLRTAVRRRRAGLRRAHAS